MNMMMMMIYLICLLFTKTSRGAGLPYWQQVGNEIYGEAASDASGMSVSLNGLGNIVAISSVKNDDGGADAGHVRVYEETNGVWSQLGSDMDGDAASDVFGMSVDLNDAGDIVAIGAMWADTASSNEGSISIFEYGTDWTQVGQVIDGNQADAWCGNDVSINANGSIVAFGCHRYDGTGPVPETGVARIYSYDETSTSWVQLGSDIQGKAVSDYFGYSVALNAEGDIIAIGASYHDSAAGHVQIYQYDSGTSSWQQLGTDIDGATAGDRCGFTVALNAIGDTILFSCTHSDGNGLNAGHSSIYQYNDGGSADWTQLGTDINGEGSDDYTGSALDINDNGDIIAIGTPNNDGNGGNAGHVRLYQWIANTSNWNQIGNDIDGDGGTNYFGISVALSNNGQIFASGAEGDDNANGVDSGSVIVYQVLDFVTSNPTVHPTAAPTVPSYNPTISPSEDPTTKPTAYPSFNPSNSPTQPTVNPTYNPSSSPTLPTLNPSADPTIEPTANPTQSPTCEAVETECTETFTVHLDCNQDQKLLFGVIGFLGVLVLILLIMLCCCQRNKTGYVQIMKQLKQNNQINPAGDELLEA